MRASRSPFFIGKGKMDTATEIAMQKNPIELGENLVIRILDDKTLVTGQSRTLIKEGNFILDAAVIHIVAGPGIKISSKGDNTLVISCDHTKLETKLFDLKNEVDKRLDVIEKCFTKILKSEKK